MIFEQSSCVLLFVDTAVTLKTQTDQIRATEHQVHIRKCALATEVKRQFALTSKIKAVV